MCHHVFYMSSGIKAIIFDYGNVLCEPQPAEEVQAIAALLRIPQDELVDRYWRDRLAYDRADLDPGEYWTRLVGRRLDASDLQAAIHLDNKSWTHPRMQTLQWVDTARRNGLHTALLSNLPLPLRDALEQDCPWLPPFDVRTYSCSVRAVKPDRAIYEECLRELGVKPQEAVFLDDRRENIDGAGHVGIHGVWFHTAEGAAKQLAAEYGIAMNGHAAD